MEPRKRLYETTFIVNASLEDTQIEGAITHIQEVITRNGGEITAVNRWGRKRLAYTIQKKNNGYYANLEFLGTEPVIAQLQRTFQLDQNFLRYLTIQIDKLSLKARAMAPPPPPAAAAPLPPPPAVPAPAAQPLAAEAVPAPPAEPEKKPLFEDEPGEKKSM
jgi:small subunit ribosomal protein S6